MNTKKVVIPIIVAAVIIAWATIYCTTVKASNNSNVTYNNLSISDPLFSTEQSSLYYKLEQAMGDVGIPNDSITVNLNTTVTINGKEYYKVYNYATKSAHINSKTINESTSNNFSQLISQPIYISKSGDILYSVCNDTMKKFDDNLNELTTDEKYNSLYQIVSEYINSYTANNPDFELSKSKNYEGNLNKIPNINVNLSDYKIINNIKCYYIEFELNSKKIILYASLGGYIYISSKTTFNELFFS